MIGDWSLEQVRERLQGNLVGDDRAFAQVVTDSRKCAAGDLFVALRGEHFDGHTFAADISESQAAAVMVERNVAAKVSQLIVRDCVEALGLLGRMNRERFQGPVVAITGSNGKTTVKEMVAAILSRQGQVCWTQGNLNNHLGVPLSLLRLSEAHQYGVFELGANHKGEIAYTVQLAQPDVAILNNAGDAHLEGFGSHQGIAEGKGEIIAGLPAQGIAILNRTSDYYDYWTTLVGGRKQLSFGWNGAADVFATDVTCAESFSEFNLHVPGRVLWVRLPLAGRHNVLNALAAAAATYALGVSPETIIAGLADVKTVGGRLRQCQTPEGALVIDDTYNASPASMKAGIDVLASLPGKRIAILGHMAELGDFAPQSHREIGAYARGRVDELWVMGQWAADYANGYGSDCVKLADVNEAVDRLKPCLAPRLAVLVKGSRSARMERVVNGILHNTNNTERSAH